MSSLNVCQEYLPNTRPEPGVSSLEVGEEFYQECLKWHTSTDFTAEQIHQKGLQEVDRIEGKMQQVPHPATAAVRARVLHRAGPTSEHLFSKDVYPSS